MKFKPVIDNKKTELGIALDNELKIKSIVSDTLPIYVRIFQIILIFLATICPIFAFLEGFKFKLNYGLIVGILLICVVIEYIAYRIIKIYDQSLPAMLVVLMYCIFLVAMFKKISSGFLKIVEEYISYFNFHYNTDFILNIKVSKDAMENATWLVLLILVFVSLVISYLIVVDLNKYVYLCTTALWPMICYSAGCKPSFIFFISYIVITIIIFGMDSISKNYEISDEIHGASKKQILFKDMAMIKIGITVGIFAICFLLVFYTIFSKNKYDKSDVFKNISDNMKSSIENITTRDDEQVDAFDRQTSSDNSKGEFNLNNIINKRPVINNGKISEAGSVKFYNKNVFRVVSNEITDTLYLKEFVGLTYKNGWITESNNGDISAFGSLDNVLADTLKSNKGKNVKQEIPYDLVSILSVDEDSEGDLIPTGSNVKYTMIDNGLVKYENNSKVVAGYEFEFATLYNLRDKIVYDYSKNISTDILQKYLYVPEEHKKAINEIKPELDAYIQQLNKMYINGSDYNNKKELLTVRALVEYFNSNYTYTLHPGKSAKDIDPIEFFLLDNKKGYCMYYAAAATSILRAYGIPTRYVEGYVIRAKDTESAKRANRDKYVDKLKNYDDTWYSFNLVPLYEYNVKDTNGHAWVEVYINGLGWVPVEVTSSQLSESREQMELEQAISEIDNNPTMTAQPSTTQAPNDVTDNSAEPIQETNKPKINTNK